MRNVNEYHKAHRLYITRTSASPSGKTTWQSGYGIRKYVTSSAVLKGDYVTPQPWSYSVATEDPCNGMTLSRVKVVSNGTWNESVYFDHISSVTNNDWGSGLSFNDNVYNGALSKLNEHVRGTLDLSVALAESGATVRMFRVLKRIREWHWKLNVRNILKDVANARLEYSYGIKPLLSDLYGALDMMTNVVTKNIEHVRVRETSHINKVGTVRINPLLYGLTTVPSKTAGAEFCEIGMSFKTDGHDISKWTSLNPVSLLYETMPYSFVIDWMYDLGSYIRNLETSLLYANSFVSGYVSRGINIDMSYSVALKRSTGTSVRTDNVLIASGMRNVRIFDRAVLKAYPSPRLPRFEADLGSGQLLNLAALMSQVLKYKYH